MNLRIHPEAEREADRATDRYARDDPHVAVRFNDALARAIDEIALQPRMYPEADDAPEVYEVRNHLLHRFPFRVVYWMTPEQIVILAVAHTKRRPGYWLDRLTEDS